MKYCKRCLYPANHPLHLTFDESGICSGCRVHEEKDQLDWTERSLHLSSIFDAYRDESGNNYDCIIPVSGGRDSYFIVDTVKRKYGMNPLLLSYNRHHNTKRGIRNLAYLRTQLDCDFMQSVVQPQIVIRLCRETLRTMGSMYWHVLAGQSAFPVQVAVRLKIPLIVWGVHQGCDQVGMFSHLDEVEMTRKYRCEHDLMGYEAESLIGMSETLTYDDLRPYIYPADREIESVGVRGIYLSNYMRWDTKAQHETMQSKYGYEFAKQQRTFDNYNDVDCVHYSGIHDYLKFLKWGYGKASDHATREIRLKRLSRKDGISLVALYQDIVPSDLQTLLRFINMPEKELFSLMDKHRDPAIWSRSAIGAWALNDSVAQHRNDVSITRKHKLMGAKSCQFRLTPSKALENEQEYTLLDRGWID